VVWLPACNTPFLRLIKCVVPGLVAAGIYPPKAKVTRSNRDGCATHRLTPEYAVALCACPRPSDFPSVLSYVVNSPRSAEYSE
jgi:hypothetical protein